MQAQCFSLAGSACRSSLICMANQHLQGINEAASTTIMMMIIIIIYNIIYSELVLLLLLPLVTPNLISFKVCINLKLLICTNCDLKHLC